MGFAQVAAHALRPVDSRVSLTPLHIPVQRLPHP